MGRAWDRVGALDRGDGLETGRFRVHHYESSFGGACKRSAWCTLPIARLVHFILCIPLLMRWRGYRPQLADLLRPVMNIIVTLLQSIVSHTNSLNFNVPRAYCRLPAKCCRQLRPSCRVHALRVKRTNSSWYRRLRHELDHHLANPTLGIGFRALFDGWNSDCKTALSFSSNISQTQ